MVGDGLSQYIGAAMIPARWCPPSKQAGELVVAWPTSGAWPVARHTALPG
jgi:hypothetical protein